MHSITTMSRLAVIPVPCWSLQSSRRVSRLALQGQKRCARILSAMRFGRKLLFSRARCISREGLHPTAVLGTVGATAAVAYLHRLSQEKNRNALAVAASMASGLVANFGTMTKPLTRDALRHVRSTRSVLLSADSLPRPMRSSTMPVILPHCLRKDEPIAQQQRPNFGTSCVSSTPVYRSSVIRCVTRRTA